ncbi:FMRFamide receptor [Lepeophtheirus salmonis]|uniref:FMRFamide receptor n=1 Tax=Lepeophtheirus salmonis TaxID=72036 RepID=UPI003AF35FCE
MQQALLNDTNSLANEEKEFVRPEVSFEFLIAGFFLNIIGILGLVGNLLSIAILSRPQMKGSTNTILIGLASFDIILILTSILMFGIPAWNGYTKTIFAFYCAEIFPYITPFIYPVGLIAQTGSVYLTLTVTMERYIAVCLPLKARSLCTYGRAKVCVVTTVLFAAIYNIPRFFEITRTTVYDPKTQANISQVNATDLRRNSTYISVYITWMYLVVMYIIPFSCLAMFNLLIYRAIRAANTMRAKLSRHQKREISSATMLMCVVWAFFICNILPLVVNILELLKIEKTALTNLSNLLVTLNSSVNFIIYCIFGDKFKRIFLKLFCWKRCNNGLYMDDTLGRYPSRVIRHNTRLHDDHLNGESRKHFRFNNNKDLRIPTEFDRKGLNSPNTTTSRSTYALSTCESKAQRNGRLYGNDISEIEALNSPDLVLELEHVNKVAKSGLTPPRMESSSV